MKKHKIIIIVLAVVLLIAAATATVLVVVNNPDNPDNPNKPDTPSGSLTRVDFGDKFGGKVNQWQQTLGTVARNIPTSASSEGCNERYPTYGSNIDFSDEEKDNILQENALIVASDTTYDSMDADGNFYLKGEATGKKLYKHVASEGMYYGNVFDDQPAVVERITVTATEQRNYVTGLYAAPGEVVKIEISEADLAAVGGSLTVVVGQVSHRNNVNNIWKEKSFVRMPVIATKFVVTAPTSYVGFHLGGPIFIYPTTANGETFTVTVSGAVKYAHYIHGQTTREQVEEMKTYSAPYYDYEVWDMGVRMSGASAYGNYDYDNLVAVGDLWEKIVRTSRQVPTSANATISVGYVYDCFVAAGAACAFQGGHSWVNAPSSWMVGALDYKAFVTTGSWGNIHEYNHLYQSYGMEPSKTNEVTNNATSLLSYLSYTDISSARSTDDKTLGGDWNRYTDPSRSLRETIANAANGTEQRSLNAYADIIHAFGTDLFTEAARTQVGFGVDNWYAALSQVTGYNFTYYFEKLLGLTLSDEVKAQYDLPDKTLFVPVATVFQTGRSYISGGKQMFTDTVRPYRIERGTTLDVDFNTQLILPNGFSFTIKSVGVPDSGRFVKVADNVYRYTPGPNELSGNIDVVVGLSSPEYSTADVTLRLNFRQYDKNQIDVTKYTYDGETSYATVADAVANNFAGYSAVDSGKSTTTFVNGLRNKQIGVAEGKIYIAESGEYAICLRSGRGNNTLYLAVNDRSQLAQVLSLDTDHGGFALEGEHVVKLSLKAGDYVYFREITLSRHYADAFTELGLARLDVANPTMRTVPTSILCTNDMTMPVFNFTAEAKYPRQYEAGVVDETDSGEHTLVEANMPSWSDNESVENIFDGNPDTFYHNNRNNFVSADNPFVLVADMGKTGKYNSITVASRRSGQLNLPCTFTLYGSTDGAEWNTLGEFADLPIVGNTVTANFDTAEFRYYKLAVTDTKSATAGNKYVTIAYVRFAYNFVATEVSAYEAEYYTDGNTSFAEVATVSSFGTVVKGNGTIKYSFTGSKFALNVRQNEACEIVVKVDGKETRVTLSANSNKTLAFVVEGLAQGEHTVEVTVLQGNICVDSLYVG